MENPAVQALLEKVKVVADDRFTSQYPKHWGCAMRVTMKDGMVHSYEVRDPSGSIARPLTREQAMDKTRTFLSVAYAGHENEVVEQILGLDKAEQIQGLLYQFSPTLEAFHCCGDSPKAALKHFEK